MIVVAMAAIVLTGCERFPQAVYNCNAFAVTIEGSPLRPPIPGRSGFWTRNPDNHYERMRYLYPDRTTRAPRVLEVAELKAVRNKQGGPFRTDEQKTADICAAFGPGMLVVINDGTFRARER